MSYSLNGLLEFAHEFEVDYRRAFQENTSIQMESALQELCKRYSLKETEHRSYEVKLPFSDIIISNVYICKDTVYYRNLFGTAKSKQIERGMIEVQLPKPIPYGILSCHCEVLYDKNYNTIVNYNRGQKLHIVGKATVNISFDSDYNYLIVDIAIREK